MGRAQSRERGGRSPVRGAGIGRAPILCLVAWALTSCATPLELRGFRSIWRQYERMPDERAIAVASDDELLWVAGASGGHGTKLEASNAALAECNARRAARDIRAECRLLAVGDRRILVD